MHFSSLFSIQSTAMRVIYGPSLYDINISLYKKVAPLFVYITFSV